MSAIAVQDFHAVWKGLPVSASALWYMVLGIRATGYEASACTSSYRSSTPYSLAMNPSRGAEAFCAKLITYLALGRGRTRFQVHSCEAKYAAISVPAEIPAVWMALVQKLQ